MTFTENFINKIHNIDAFLGLKEIDDNSISHIIIDPPYLINYLNEKWDKIETILNWELLFTEFKRILKENSNLIIFQGWSNICETISIGKRYFKLINWIIYDRIKGRGAKYNFVSTREDILWFSQSSNPIFNKIYSEIPKKTKGMGLKNGQLNRCLSNVWSDCPPLVPWSKEKVKHPTQKSLFLMKRLITIFSNPNDLILDCFAGSGSTLVAAKDLSRNYIGFENNKEYFDIAVDRLEGVI